MITYKFGDILLIDFLQSSDGQKKKRPSLVVLDIGDSDIVLAPITTVKRTGLGDCNMTDWSNSGLLRESWIRLAKIACLSKNDVIRQLGQISDDDKEMAQITWNKLYTLKLE